MFVIWNKKYLWIRLILHEETVDIKMYSIKQDKYQASAYDS